MEKKIKYAVLLLVLGNIVVMIFALFGGHSTPPKDPIAGATNQPAPLAPPQ